MLGRLARALPSTRKDLVSAERLLNKLSNPPANFIQRQFVDLFLRDRVLLGHSKGMIAVFDGEKRGIAESLDDRCKFSRRTERVAGSLNKEHRGGDFGKVLRAKLVGLARGVERIAEEDQSRNVLRSRRGNLRSDPAAHRLASDHERVFCKPGVGPNTGYHCVAARLELVAAIGRPASLLGVKEVECGGIDAARRQSFSEPHHESVALSCAGAVSQENRDG